jgi:hypothetical protein
MTDQTDPSDTPNAQWAPPPFVIRLTLLRVTSVILFSQRSRVTKSGSPDELSAFYKSVFWHNVTLGWWGLPFGLIYTIGSLSQNSKARQKIRALQASGAAPEGWYPDPAGRAAGRYWNGAAWTQRVRTEGVDDSLASPTP